MDKQSYQAVVLAISSCAVVLSFGTLAITLKTGSVPEGIAPIIVSTFGILGSLLVPVPNQKPRE